MSDHQFKVVMVESEFEWRRRADTDETFVVLDVALRIYFRGASADDGLIVLRAG
ncbi:hypothetical protein JOE11_001842 [Robbsia andropogonis]